MTGRRGIILLSVVVVLLIGLAIVFYLCNCGIERGSGGVGLVCYPRSQSSDSDCEKKYRSCLKERRRGINVVCFSCD